MRILFIGDIFGRPGRQAVSRWLKPFVQSRGVDFVVANAENSAAGKGLTEKIAREYFKLGIGALTGGNHSFAVRDSYALYDQEPRVLRPGNLPPGTPGQGWGIFDIPGVGKLGVLNLIGRAFMRQADCPMRYADEALESMHKHTDCILVDFHAEASSEKIALTAYLDGRVSAVLGTHTHIPTADARICSAGTAAITDVGMSGPYDSVIGVESSIIIEQMLTGLPVRHEVATGDVRIAAVLLDFDTATGSCTRIEQVLEPGYRTQVGDLDS